MPQKSKYCYVREESNCVTCLKKRFSLLEGLNEQELAILERNRTHLLFARGEPIYKEGAKPMGLLCLSQGKMKVTKNGPRLKEQIISLKKPVDFIGFSELMTNEPYTASGIAIEESSVCFIDVNDFFTVMKNNADFFIKVTRFLSAELHHTANRIVTLTQKDMRARLADALLYILDIYGLKQDNQTLDVIMKRADIGALANMTTSNVIRTLSAFKDEGIIEIAHKEIKIIRPDELAAISG